MNGSIESSKGFGRPSPGAPKSDLSVPGRPRGHGSELAIHKSEGLVVAVRVFIKEEQGDDQDGQSTLGR